MEAHDGRLQRVSNDFLHGFFFADHNSATHAEETTMTDDDFLASPVRTAEEAAADAYHAHLEQAATLRHDPTVRNLLELYNVLVLRFVQLLCLTVSRRNPVWTESYYDSLNWRGRLLHSLGLLHRALQWRPHWRQRLGTVCWVFSLGSGTMRICDDGRWEFYGLRKGSTPLSNEPQMPGLVITRTFPMYTRHGWLLESHVRSVEGTFPYGIEAQDVARQMTPDLLHEALQQFLREYGINSTLR